MNPALTVWFWQNTGWCSPTWVQGREPGPPWERAAWWRSRPCWSWTFRLSSGRTEPTIRRRETSPSLQALVHFVHRAHMTVLRFFWRTLSSMCVSLNTRVRGVMCSLCIRSLLRTSIACLMRLLISLEVDCHMLGSEPFVKDARIYSTSKACERCGLTDGSKPFTMWH